MAYPSSSATWLPATGLHPEIGYGKLLCVGWFLVQQNKDKSENRRGKLC
jgi:hypothetical protein